MIIPVFLLTFIPNHLKKDVKANLNIDNKITASFLVDLTKAVYAVCLDELVVQLIDHNFSPNYLRYLISKTNTSQI